MQPLHFRVVQTLGTNFWQKHSSKALPVACACSLSTPAYFGSFSTFTWWKLWFIKTLWCRWQAGHCSIFPVVSHALHRICVEHKVCSRSDAIQLWPRICIIMHTESAAVTDFCWTFVHELYYSRVRSMGCCIHVMMKYAKLEAIPGFLKEIWKMQTFIWVIPSLYTQTGLQNVQHEIGSDLLLIS